MNRNRVASCCVLILAAVVLIFSSWTSAQTGGVLSRITQAVDEAKTFRLQGNTHPMARPEFDQGAASPDLPLEHMLLVLKSSPDQQVALSKLLDEQQDRSSPNFHKWLTPAEFGQQFGASEDDIQIVSSWLESHGFRIDQVTAGHTLIEFSGTSANVKDAFRTEIHKYLVNGEEHWANASDPQIPAALAPVVAGVNTLHNFRRHPMSHRVGAFERSKATGKVSPRHSDFTFPTANGCGGIIASTNDCFAVGPTDFATIYNVLPLWNAATPIDGAGVTIAIVGSSNINVQDAHDFRALFGLPVNDPHVIVATGATDPGVQPCPNGNECEADIDTQWAGAVAKGATIDLVIAKDTATPGVDTAAVFIVNAMSPRPQILSESFGNCELNLGTAGNQMFGGGGGVVGLWPQAASEHITVVLSTGDTGSADCEPNPVNSGQNTRPQPVTTGLAVSGLASTTNNTAVGGTDFDQLSNPFMFWNTTNAPLTQASAKGYIPETTWNESCTNLTWGLVGFSTSAQTNCNNTNLRPSFVIPVGGGGGVSTIYSKPTWQTGNGVPNDGKRDLPDISLFAGSGFVDSFYVVCERDDPGQAGPCSTSAFLGFGGTSVSAQAFAGIVALIDQKKGAPQGRINDRLYQLAGQANAVCPSAQNPGGTCIFYDVTKGTIAQPCVNGSTNCSETTTSLVAPSLRITSRATTIFATLACISLVATLMLGVRLKERNWSAAFAILIFALFITCAACGSGGGGSTGSGKPADGILSGFDAGPGYDQATGLGTVNVTNLVNNW